MTIVLWRLSWLYGKKSYQMFKVIRLSGYQSKQDISSLSKSWGYGGYFSYIGYMIKKSNQMC